MIICVLLMFSGISARRNVDVELRPGSGNSVEAVEEVRSHENETTTTTDFSIEYKRVIKEAVLDVAYYLRRFKFNGRDPRYETSDESPKPSFFTGFPSPPLRNIHWEVKKNCEPAFVECVKYLQEKVSLTRLPRHLDSLTITKLNGWSFITDESLIQSADAECLKLLEDDENGFAPFSTPLEKFRWLVSASYYMCNYAAKQISLLRFFEEDCDNFGSCIAPNGGLHNDDVRADDGRPFACALYSFCPDPCCPLKRLPARSACFEANVCSELSPSGTDCHFPSELNADFDAMIFNQWNVSCSCEQFGTRWDSKSGMCIDIDECTETDYPCKFPTETCKNLPGSYRCSCSFLGYRKKPDSDDCEQDPVVHNLLFPSNTSQHNNSKSLMNNFRDMMYSIK